MTDEQIALVKKVANGYKTGAETCADIARAALLSGDINKYNYYSAEQKRLSKLRTDTENLLKI